MNKISITALYVFMIHQSVMSMSLRSHLATSLILGASNMYVVDHALKNQQKFDVCNNQYKYLVTQKQQAGFLGFPMDDTHCMLDRSFHPYSQHIAAVTSVGLSVICYAPAIALAATCTSYGVYGVYTEGKMLDQVLAVYQAQKS